MNDSRENYSSRVFISAIIVALITLLLLLLWYAADVLLLGFAGILVAIFLRGLSDWVSERTHLSGGWSLALVVLGLVSLVAVVAWVLAPDVAAQVDELRRSLPQSMRRLSERIEQYEWGRQILAQLPNANELMPGRADVLARVTGIFSTTLGLFADLFIIISIGLYLAVEPRLYTRGVILLVPASRRERARAVLNEVGSTLRWWLIGKAASMVVIGTLTALGLWLLNVPLALTLGLLAAVLTFIPNIGPILSVVPAALLALLQSPTRALYVILLYLGIQTLESYLLTPMVQRRAVQLPPALTIFSQVLLGVLVGGLGLALATPLTAAALVLARMIYVEGTTDDSIENAHEA